jgi:hypothetical protein
MALRTAAGANWSQQTEIRNRSCTLPCYPRANPFKGVRVRRSDRGRAGRRGDQEC